MHYHNLQYHDNHLENSVGYYVSSCIQDTPCVPDLNFIITIIIMRKFQRNSSATKYMDNKQKNLCYFYEGLCFMFIILKAAIEEEQQN